MDLPTISSSFSAQNGTSHGATVPERLLSAKELAHYLGRHPNYIYLMKRAGFPMPGNRATLTSAVRWLEKNPNWRQNLPPGIR